MMKEKRLKYFFFTGSAFFLFVMVFLSRNAGISCDEVLHYQHSVSVCNYFASHGQDQSALNTPVTHLKYYGQSCDNIVTIISNLLGIDNIYGFRHIMSSIAGWLTIFVTALFAIWLSGYRTGILVLFLFAISPTFMGHAQNNLKDIPFALGYILSVFFTLKIFSSEKKTSFSDILLLILSIAFALSIRTVGLLLICYLFIFFLIILAKNYIKDGRPDFNENGKRLIFIILIACAAYFLSILLWPFALQSPFKNVIGSYRVMAHFPDTFRQIFEGKFEWSDFMPWYYLPKSMAITIPVIIFTGFFICMLFTKKIFDSGKALIYGIIIFTILFPVFFAIIIKSNIYSSWRQFLFVYPGIILLAATGFSFLFDFMKSRISRWILFAVLFMLSIHPVSFMNHNRSYYYLYYNQLVKGLNGAYGNYETDYYYLSQTEASEWLINYLKDKSITTPLKVKATYPVQWQFRNHPLIETSYFRFEERSQSDWDYAIVANRYIPLFKLKNNLWPPENAIHVIYTEDVPICAVLERKTKTDYYGFKALEEGNVQEAIKCFDAALKINSKDEMIFYNFARALYDDGQHEKADSVLKKGLELNPDFEPILMYLGNIAKVQKRTDAAILYYEKLISVNRKYFEAYVELAGLLAESDLQKARGLLRACLTINPKYKPAITGLADSYRKTDPDVAEKYDKLAETIK
ncbi:MAG: tetratricopeptide repeat protein [Bacteroidales bacterium]|nr:tetratricopeptide repeat protein [Bacteroidales bacterium]